VNTCIAIRGQPLDYEEWELPGWSWEECLTAFRTMERDLDFGDAPWHGNQGPMPIRRHPPEEWTAWQAAFVEACREAGHEPCADTNEPDSVGVGPHAMNKVDGRRISAAEAFLSSSVRARDTLTIHADTTVERVLFDGKRAVGVRVSNNEHGSYDVLADEVIVSAGAINTPHLLMRSGVGPRETLSKWGVELVADSPGVARQLLDHPGVAIFLWPRFFAGTSYRDDLIQTACRYASETVDMPNDLIMQAGSTVPTPWATIPLVSIMVMVGKPRGRGTIEWRSADVGAAPQIRSSLLHDEFDRNVAVRALEHCFEVANSPAARAVAKPIYPSVRTLRNRQRLRDKVMTICDSGYHPCGTVQMGTTPDTPCDARGRVRNVENLRVVDASLMPTIPHANIHLSVLMMAERIADWL
jgi:choline dehydrogenase